MVNFGCQFAGGISINKDVFDSFPPEIQKIFIDVGKEYTKKLAEAQAARADSAVQTMKDGGAKVVVLSPAEQKRWAAKLPNVPKEWAASMEEKGLPGKAMLKGYLDGLRNRNVALVRDWDKE
jgi:TRAP-type C4-dicarboxylate transport system substrate-binding protein